MGRRIASNERPASSARVFKTEFILGGSDAGSSRENSYTPSPGASTTGRLDQRDFERQTGAASCLLLILAAIIYWQIREIDRVLSEAGSDADDLTRISFLAVLERIR